jgi:phosphatidate cytidylyltransferase
VLVQRLLVVILLVPVFAAVIAIGGWVYVGVIALALGIAAWEYWRMFHQGGYRPSLAVMVGGTALLALLRGMFGFAGGDGMLALVVMAAMTVHLSGYEKGRDEAATDFNITLGGVLYLGWLGGYLISLRNLTDGLWWVLLVLPAVWFADGGAFAIGRRWGKHSLSPRLSPKKTWEGYLGGIACSALFTSLLAALWNLRTPAITPLRGLVLGVVLAAITPLGDLGESMIKRQFGVKDTSQILPGHGGIMDRIDSWLWAAAISYYLIIWVW